MILHKMLSRLYAGLVSGPCLNARPHSSRQRIDLTKLKALQSKLPEEIMDGLLGKSGEVEIAAKVPVFAPPETDRKEWTPVQREAETKSKDQENLLQKLRQIAQDAGDYENDHGESALCLGYPLLHMPPSPDRTTRIVAPIAFIAVSLGVRTSARRGVTLICNAEGVDRVVPNPALMAWIRQQTGPELVVPFPDEDGQHPWEEITAIVKAVCERLEISVPAEFGPQVKLVTVAKADELGDEPSIINGAVLGLFPLANQGLLADTRWMIEQPQDQLNGPVKSFIKPEAMMPAQPRAEQEEESFAEPAARDFSRERLISQADPCQAEAVRRAQKEPALVIHGPPGTGKSQVIANIIGDHVARGERVLFVCDKRTALDVVRSRLQALGLGELCALIHDPKREQKELYLSMRNRLDGLAESPRIPDPTRELAECDRNLEQIHGELTLFHKSLHGVGPEEKSFHQLFGQWLSLAGANDLAADQGLENLSLPEVESGQTLLQEILERAVRVNYPQNPWKRRLGLPLGKYLQMTESSVTGHLARLSQLSVDLDQTIHEYLPPLSGGDLAAQAAKRAELALLVRASAQDWSPELQATLQGIDQQEVTPSLENLNALGADLDVIASTPLTPALAAVAPVGSTVAELEPRIAALEAYQPIAGKWYRAFMMSKTKAARLAIAPLSLKLSPETVAQGLQHYRGLASRIRVVDYLTSVLGTPQVQTLDADLLKLCSALRAGLSVLACCGAEPNLADLEATVKAWMAGSEYLMNLAQLLDQSAGRSRLLSQWEDEARSGDLLDDKSIGELSGAIRANAPCGEYMRALADRHTDLEDILRLESAQDSLPATMKSAVSILLAGLPSHEEAAASLRKLAIANEIRSRIHASPHLQDLTSERVDALLNSYLRWTDKRRGLTAQLILSYWQEKARKGLLAQTGTRLNGNGTALKQRLLTKGAKALKLRKMLEVGQSVEGGDPLFDLCPVWMSGPNTVAQIFPKKAIFDIVIFDEASQCRLEEALPVLLRAKRVVVAGDPKQLPPTRFFESGVVESDNDEIEDVDQLFEVQQAETEDLLGAALNISVRESYLDVHYRSTHSALINFSNQNFYNGRLQAIPAHPNSLAEVSPVRLIQVSGLYKDRTNLTEASKVVEIVDKLLASPNPPSIGIACFNLTQRETILAALNEKAEKDAVFAQRLSAARSRQGPQSFEGLFVKNLENVQGDERDHMIISTTFGFNEQGKFRRSFGPLSGANGGRRLNVLVTRARQMVHVVTSIPRSEYLAAYEVPAGAQPNGRLLLYEYLKYAERVELEFNESLKEEEELAQKVSGKMIDLASAYPSVAASALGKNLNSEQKMGGFTHWGNDGFCVDVAISHPKKPLRVTVGVLADFTRFGKAPDPIEWEVFRHFILVALTKWKLVRMWSPAAFRALSKAESVIVKAHEAELLS